MHILLDQTDSDNCITLWSTIYVNKVGKIIITLEGNYNNERKTRGYVA